ncbi:hypothetical protein VTL71DRAFT_13006 [Oculimacula yallundae]|uniref:Amidase domain-containing protein n=1 Tax=Oculimacula yallundae TaxID=86028 RepID=A0ABR4CP85_9HELO
MTVISARPWQIRAAEKAAQVTAKIPVKWRIREEELDRARSQRDLTGPFIQSFLSEAERDIVQLNSVQLIQSLAARVLTALDVATAYCKTAAIAHQINNCLHEIFFEEAFGRAAELDALMAQGHPVGPLHGLPISLKDQFHVKGIDTTMGYVGWIDTFEGSRDPDKVHRVDSQVVEELRSLGAVLYCKTSLPQTLMCGETINNIIGHTLNPVNQNLSCGGSSGGEAALQALTGSSVGLGTDVGGSLRIPAAFCGIYSLKPTHNRLSYRNVANTNPGQLNYPSAVGVMATSVDSLKLVTSALISTTPWTRDPDVVPIPWRIAVEEEMLCRATEDGKSNDNQPLKLGIMFSDGYMTPHPPVVDWNPPPHQPAAKIHLDFLVSDGGFDVHKQLDLSGEPLIPPLRDVFSVQPPFSAIRCQELSIEGRDSCAAYADYWNSKAESDGQEIDGFIMPVAPHAAVMPGRYLYTGYTEVINLLDYCTIVLPVTKADKSVDIFDHDYIPLNDLDEKNWNWYDPEIYDGAPVGLQIVARKYEEEKVWALGKIVDIILKKNSI